MTGTENPYPHGLGVRVSDLEEKHGRVDERLEHLREAVMDSKSAFEGLSRRVDRLVWVLAMAAVSLAGATITALLSLTAK